MSTKTRLYELDERETHFCEQPRYERIFGKPRHRVKTDKKSESHIFRSNSTSQYTDRARDFSTNPTISGYSLRLALRQTVMSPVADWLPAGFRYEE